MKQSCWVSPFDQMSRWRDGLACVSITAALVSLGRKHLRMLGNETMPGQAFSSAWCMAEELESEVLTLNFEIVHLAHQ